MHFLSDGIFFLKTAVFIGHQVTTDATRLRTRETSVQTLTVGPPTRPTSVCRLTADDVAQAVATILQDQLEVAFDGLPILEKEPISDDDVGGKGRSPRGTIRERRTASRKLFHLATQIRKSTVFMFAFEVGRFFHVIAQPMKYAFR